MTMKYYITFHAERLKDIAALEELASEKLNDVIVFGQGTVPNGQQQQYQNNARPRNRNVAKIMKRPGIAAVVDYIKKNPQPGGHHINDLGVIYAKNSNAKPHSLSNPLSLLTQAGVFERVIPGYYNLA